MPLTRPALSLTVQYATPAPDLPRWRLRRWVQRALAGGCTDLVARQCSVPAAVDFTIRLVDTEEGSALNETWRHGSSGPTNVLTFTYGLAADHTLHADMILCVPVIQSEAETQQKPYHHHAAHLVIHGTLHALGYDHDTDEQARVMEALETELLARARIPNPYQA